MQIDQVFEELLMKMEVLSVQNQYQGQFGVIGSSKVKDWTSPLTPPLPPPPLSTAAAFQQQLRAVNATSSNISANDISNIDQNSEDTINIDDAIANVNINNTTINTNDVALPDVDVVDGLLPRFQQSQQQQHFYHQNQHTGHQHQQQQQYQQQIEEYHQQYEHEALKMDSETAAVYTNNNLVYCNPSPADEADAETAITPILDELHFGVPASVVDDDEVAAVVVDEIDEDMVYELSQRLQAELRAAKSRHLACTEVSLPWDLTPRIAREIIKISEREPCGVRGCSIFIEFEDEPNNTRRIASFKVDPDMVSTFELYLTLKHDRSGWSSLIPQFLKNLTRSNTILISPDFTLTKNKLYSCE